MQENLEKVMDEKGKESVRWGRILQFGVPIASATIALISLLVGIASRKKELTCSLFASSSIVTMDPSGIDPDLRVQFHGDPVKTLSKLVFSIRNSGSAAIKIDDVKEPLRLKFPSRDKILTAVVDRTAPQQFPFAVRLDPATNSIVCDFPLLNPGDEAFFSVYVQATGSVNPLFEGRIVDVPQMLYLDKSDLGGTPGPRFLSSHSVRTIFRWTLFVLYCALTLLMLAFWVFETIEQIKDLIWLRHYRDPLNRAIDEAKRENAETRARDEVNYKDSPGYVSYVPAESYFRYAAESRLTKAGIPKRAEPIFASASGYLGGTLLALTLSALTGLTAWIIIGALKG